MRLSRSCIVAIAAAAFLLPNAANALPITLSTPVIVSGPVTGNAVVAGPKPAQWFAGTWWSPSANQTFANPYAGGGDLPGDYVYRITFDLTGLDPATAVLSGAWTTDNAGSIWLNGVQLGTVGSTAYTGTTAFSFTSGFVGGVNQLDFHVNNEDAAGQQTWEGPNGLNPTGVHYSVTQATADRAPELVPVPEPTTIALLGLGLAGLRSRRLRGTT